MRKVLQHFSVFAFCLVSVVSFGQTPQNTPRHPVVLDSSFFKNLAAAPQHPRVNRLSASTNAAMANEASGSAQTVQIRTVPHFSSSFTFQGQTFPFTMVGHRPQAGGTTRVDTAYVPISFVFDEFVDANGNNIVIDANAITGEILGSPDFVRSQFTTGNTQFSDAIQRAEFFGVLRQSDRDGDEDDESWHTLLERPRILTPVTVEVPFGSSIVFQLADGSFGTLMDINFINSQLNTLLQTEGVRITELPIFVTRNAVYGDFFAGNPLDCCIGGFHAAFETAQNGNTISVQTFAFATALDADASDAIFGDPTVFADVGALSHEVAEWMNDPFGNNIVPAWEFPGISPPVCQGNLETGDPVENLFHPFFPITLNGFTYHPQTEALLEWFSRQNPSSAIGGAFSYPDTTKLPGPSVACPF